MSIKDLTNAKIENLVALFLVDKSKNVFSNPEITAEFLQKSDRDSYQLNKTL